ncbi:MAG: carbohydrate-binding family 9-like protein [Flavobacteriales bacterium]|nr:carbohydrate-binding family 9-like protein [Flavobacteriales bacterium]
MKLFTFLIVGFYCAQSLAQSSLPKVYNCLQINQDITIDGQAIESAWDIANWSEKFIDIEGEKSVKPYYSTKFKMLWDTSNLYLFAVLEEEHLWATLKNHDDIIYRDNDFEVFIDPDSDNHNYMEIEVNLFNTILDLMLIKPYRNGGPLIMDWTANGMQSSISTYGTLNNPNDLDSLWCIEMALPLKVFGNVPAVENSWRINFSRVQYDMEIVSNEYEKVKNIAGVQLPEHNWVWSPQGIINMHYPENWGYLFFNDSVGSKTAKRPSDAAIRIALHELYYKQTHYLEKNGVPKEDIATEITLDSKLYKIELIIKEDDFEICATDTEWTWHIQRDSKIWKTSKQ